MRNYDDNALDLFRIMATIQVFMGHIITHFIPAPGDSVWEFVYAIRGVPILFVLCGFLASKSLENRTPKKWLIGRIARMLPAFWACIIVNTAVIAVFYPVRPSLKETVVYIVTQFSGLNFYTGSWLRGYGVGTPNGVLWTIAVQIQFFIIAPFIHRFLTRKGGYKGLQCVAGLTLVSVACNHLDGRIPEILWKLLGVTVIPYLYFLVFGMMLWYHRDQIIPRAERYRWLLLAVYVMWKLAENNLNFPHVLDGVLYNTVATLLMALLVSGFGFRRRIRFSADYTYGFYLYHMVFSWAFIPFCRLLWEHCGLLSLRRQPWLPRGCPTVLLKFLRRGLWAENLWMLDRHQRPKNCEIFTGECGKGFGAVLFATKY